MAYDWKTKVGGALKSLSGGYQTQQRQSSSTPTKTNRPSMGSRLIGMFGKKKKKGASFDYEGNA